jgi:hypothetical protein
VDVNATVKSLQYKPKCVDQEKITFFEILQDDAASAKTNVFFFLNESFTVGKMTLQPSAISPLSV